jgi:hypothetical protein
MPTKEELRLKYGITEQDFVIMTQADLPTAETLRNEGACLEKAGYWERFEVWLKKSVIGGPIYAVMLIGALVAGVEAIEKYGPIVWANGNQAISYVSHYAQFATDEAKGFLVHTTTPPTPEDKRRPDPVLFWTGSHVYPLSGQWQPS